MPETALANTEFVSLKTLALEFVNQCRLDLGLPVIDRLPKGIPGQAGSCAIARGLRQDTPYGAIVTSGKVWLTATSQQHPSFFSAFRSYSVPIHVYGFIEHFDKGHYPDLIAS